MLKTRLDPTNANPVDMDGVEGVSMRVLLGREHGMPNFSMRHFVVEPNGHTPHHSHDYEHQVVVMAGEGEQAKLVCTHCYHYDNYHCCDYHDCWCWSSCY